MKERKEGLRKISVDDQEQYSSVQELREEDALHNSLSLTTLSVVTNQRNQLNIHSSEHCVDDDSQK